MNEEELRRALDLAVETIEILEDRCAIKDSLIETLEERLRVVHKRIELAFQLVSAPSRLTTAELRVSVRAALLTGGKSHD